MKKDMGSPKGMKAGLEGQNKNAGAEYEMAAAPTVEWKV